MDRHQAILRCDTALWVTTSTTSPSHLTHPSHFSLYPHPPSTSSLTLHPLSPSTHPHSPPTLTLHPHLLLLPHTTVKDLVMTVCVYVDEDTAPVLTSHKEQFDDILVLHLEKGTFSYPPSVSPSPLQSE